jgi:hypothetical protein
MTDPLLPADAIEILVNKVVAKFTQGEISFEEASVRLLGTGRFEEKPEAVSFLKTDVCPKLEERLAGLDDEIVRLQAEADRIRGILGMGSSALSPASVFAPGTGAAPKARAPKAAEKKRRGAQSETSSDAWTGEADGVSGEAHGLLEVDAGIDADAKETSGEGADPTA